MKDDMSLLDLLIKASARSKVTMTKAEFGIIMHDPNATEEEIQAALDCLEDAEGYENLAD